MARFLFHAQDQNMTNGDFSFFTFWWVRDSVTDRPWTVFVTDPDELPRRRRVFEVVKLVRTYYCALQHLTIYTRIELDTIEDTPTTTNNNNNNNNNSIVFITS